MIKRILALRYVCKKYNLKYNVKLFGEVGWIESDTRRFCVSLFQKNFYEVLYHEIGHLIADRSLNFPAKHENALQTARLRYLNVNHDLLVRLEEEATASKFAFRVLKTKEKKFLKRCWYTYTSDVAKYVNADERFRYIDVVAKYNKYFE